MCNSKHTFKVKAATVIKQYQPVKLDGGELVPVAAATDLCIGVISDGAEGGELRSVVLSGIEKAVVDGSGTAIVMGDELMSAAGKFVKHDGADAKLVVGIALEGSTANGDHKDVLIFDHKKAKATSAT